MRRCEMCGSESGRIVSSRNMHYGRIRRAVCLSCGHRWTEYMDRAGCVMATKPRGRRKVERNPMRCRKPVDDPVLFSERVAIPRHRIAELLAEATTPAVQEYLARLQARGGREAAP